jgi:large subunit ribosomal protein L15
MDLSKIKLNTKNKSPKRVGRGPGSGHGKTSGRGHRGSGQRKGRMFYIGFGGGNVPYLRKIPKRGFNPKRRVEYQIVNLEDIVKRLSKITEITPKELREANLIKDEKKPVKILAKLKGKFSKSYLVKVHKFSKKAKEIIEEAGGRVECLKL